MQIQVSAFPREWGLRSKYARTYSLLCFIEISIEHAKHSEMTRVCLNDFVVTVSHFIRYLTQEQNKINNIIVPSNYNE